MANPIIVPKKSTVSSKVPITSDLALGEIAINHADKKLYARHPITGVVQEIGSLTAHSHDQLISVDSTADLELQNNGSVIITDGAIPTTLALSSTTARTITFPDKTGTVALLDDVGGGGGATVSSTAPASPSEGDLWLDSDTFELFVYYDNAWIEAVEQGDTINNNYLASKTLARFTPRENQPPATAYATLDTRNSVAVLDFDAATIESAIFPSIIPEAADLARGLSVRITWMATTATSGDVRWRVALERGTTDLDADSFDTAAEGNGAANGTSGIPTTTSISLTTLDSVAVGEPYRLLISRLGSDATNDTMTGDAELIAVEIRSAA